MAHISSVLLCITKSNFGGAQRYVYDLACGLQKRHVHVSVALGGDGELAQKLRGAGIPVYEIPSLVREVSFVDDIRSLIALASLVRTLDPDIIHGNSSKMGLLASLVGRVLGVPRVIFTAHGWAHNESRSLVSRSLFWTLQICTILLSHSTITVSQASREQMAYPIVRKRMHTIHNGMSAVDFYTRNDARAALIEHCPTLAPHYGDFWSISIGELHPNKQHTTSVNSLRQVVAKNSNVRHLIIGEGEERERLEHLIATQQLTNHVFLLGRIPNAARLLTGADLFLFPSLTEALPYALIEAAQAGLPIIASDVGGISEIVTSGKSASLIPSGDAPALARSYEYYLNNPEVATRHGMNAMRHVQEFTLERMVEKTFRIYEG